MIHKNILALFGLAAQIFSHSLSAQEFEEQLVNVQQQPNPITVSIQPVLDIKLNSDKSTINGKTGVFEHCGNAVLVQGGLKLTANCLIGKKIADGSYAYIVAKGKPASLVKVIDEKQQELQVSGDSIEYKVPDQKFIILGDGELTLIQNPSPRKTPANMKINAQEIVFDDSNENSKKIVAEGSPLGIILTKSDSVKLEAKSKRLYFDSETSDLKLSEDVTANLALGQISAGVFEYNSETQISSFEKSNNEQIEIIQSKKQPK